MTSTELLEKVKKVWTGNELIKIRELDHNLNIFQLKDILLNSDKTFLTKDEIFYNVLKLRAEQINKDINLTYFCTGCKEINEENVTIDINDLPFQERKDNEVLELGEVKITSIEPKRTLSLNRDKSIPSYNLDEMIACLKFENLPDGKNAKDYVLDLKISDFVILEAFYNQTKFRFQPSVSMKCPTCEKVTKIEIDTLPMDGLE